MRRAMSSRAKRGICFWLGMTAAIAACSDSGAREIPGLRLATKSYRFTVTPDPIPPFANETTWYTIKVNFLCRDSILATPIVLDLALFSDFAMRAGMKGIQEWLSFYYKSPMAAAGLEPEHDLFIQQTKLKNTLRHLMGEEQITHLGLEYYQS